MHVYYREVSDLFAPGSETPFSVARTSASDLRRWLRLLIRNEGVGNFVVLDDLLEFRRARPDYDFKFIHLVGIHMATAVARTHGVDALRNVFGVDAEVFFELYAASASNALHPLSDAIVRETPATQHY